MQTYLIYFGCNEHIIALGVSLHLPKSQAYKTRTLMVILRLPVGGGV